MPAIGIRPDPFNRNGTGLDCFINNSSQLSRITFNFGYPGHLPQNCRNDNQKLLFSTDGAS